MRAVGIRELKARLSRYLDDVRRGEVVIVTDRGKVVAEIRPPGAAEAMPSSPFERRLAALVRDGRASPGLPNTPELYVASPLSSPDGTSQRLLDELRGDR